MPNIKLTLKYLHKNDLAKVAKFIPIGHTGSKGRVTKGDREAGTEQKRIDTMELADEQT